MQYDTNSSWPKGTGSQLMTQMKVTETNVEINCKIKMH